MPLGSQYWIRYKWRDESNLPWSCSSHKARVLLGCNTISLGYSTEVRLQHCQLSQLKSLPCPMLNIQISGSPVWMLRVKLHELPRHPNYLTGSSDTTFSCKITGDDHKGPSKTGSIICPHNWISCKQKHLRESWDASTFPEKLQESSFHTWNVDPRLWEEPAHT